MTQHGNENKYTIVIGLTGGIASGKSTVSRILKNQGAVLLDGDQVAREIVQDQGVLETLEESFGKKIIDKNGNLKRKALAAIVFSDKSRLERLNRITHPKIKERMIEDLRRLRKKAAEEENRQIILLDGALLLEMGLERLVDETWVISVDQDTQLKRLMERDGIKRDEAMQRINAQMDEREKRKKADVIIENNGGIKELTEEVMDHWERLTKKLEGEGN